MRNEDLGFRNPYLVYILCAVLGVSIGLGIAVTVNSIGVTPRWMWHYESPNDLAVMASTLLAICSATLGIAHQIRSAALRAAIWLLIVVATLVLISGIAGSCSRGGVMAGAIGLLFLIFLARGNIRALTLLVLVSLISAFFFVDRASQRFSEFWHGDQSIAARYDLLVASTQMIADFPLGVGGGYFEKMADCWYMPVNRPFKHWHPLNDVLYIGCEHGLPIMALFLMALLVPLFVFSLAARENSPRAAVAAASLLALLLGGVWAGCLRDNGPLISYASVYSLVLLLGFSVRSSRSKWKLGSTIGVSTSILIASMVLFFGWWQTSALEWRPIVTADSEIAAVPRMHDGRGQIVLVAADDDEMNTIARHAMRTVASDGFRVKLHRATPPRMQLGGTAGDEWRVFLKGSDVQIAPVSQTIGIIAFDYVPESDQLKSENATPILLCLGSQLNGKLPSDQAQRLRQSSDVTVVMMPVPQCWTRHMSVMWPLASRWIASRHPPKSKDD